MMEGKCPNCGYHVFGWVLCYQKNQICPECDIKLNISEGDSRSLTDYSLYAETIEQHPMFQLPSDRDIYRNN
jgi:hypothetical protein